MSALCLYVCFLILPPSLRLFFVIVHYPFFLSRLLPFCYYEMNFLLLFWFCRGRSKEEKNSNCVKRSLLLLLFFPFFTETIPIFGSCCRRIFAIFLQIHWFLVFFFSSKFSFLEFTFDFKTRSSESNKCQKQTIKFSEFIKPCRSIFLRSAFSNFYSHSLPLVLVFRFRKIQTLFINIIIECFTDSVE